MSAWIEIFADDIVEENREIASLANVVALRRTPPRNEAREQELRQIASHLKDLRRKARILDIDIKSLEEREALLQEQNESDWKRSWR